MVAILSRNPPVLSYPIPKLCADEELLNSDLIQSVLTELWNSLESVAETKSTRWTRKGLSNGVALEKVDSLDNPDISVFHLVAIQSEPVNV